MYEINLVEEEIVLILQALDFNEEQNIHLTEVQFNIANSIRSKINAIIE